MGLCSKVRRNAFESTVMPACCAVRSRCAVRSLVAAVCTHAYDGAMQQGGHIVFISHICNQQPLATMENNAAPTVAPVAPAAARRQVPLTINCAYKRDFTAAKNGGGCRNPAVVTGAGAGFCADGNCKALARKYMTETEVDAYAAGLGDRLAACFAVADDPEEYKKAKKALNGYRDCFVGSQHSARKAAITAELERQALDMHINFIPWYLEQYTVDNVPTPQRFTVPEGITLAEAVDTKQIDTYSARGLAEFMERVLVVPAEVVPAEVVQKVADVAAVDANNQAGETIMAVVA